MNQSRIKPMLANAVIGLTHLRFTLTDRDQIRELDLSLRNIRDGIKAFDEMGDSKRLAEMEGAK